MEAGGRQADEDIARRDMGSGDELWLVNHSDDKAGEVVFSVGIKTGHLRGFSADEGAAVSATGVGQAADNFFGDVGLEPTAG